MKKLTYKVLFTILLATSILQGQGNDYIIGASGNYIFPLGEMSNRFKNTAGGSIYFGKRISTSFSWIAKFNYMKFDELNNEKLTKKISAEIDQKKMIFDVPLKEIGDFSMDFESFGISVEAKMDIINSEFINTSFLMGFGFYKWEFNRSALAGNVFVDPDNDGSQISINELNVPGSFQEDWSGQINAGLEVSIKLTGNFWLNCNGSYTLVLGELWPALSLDMGNVSGIQMLEAKAGLRYCF
ncbi:MAG: hypothetical protein JEY94_05610 [Melioribacteraceae bacterium]|nr:hypothetical protein [Melioribacteraceae bacterium]